MLVPPGGEHRINTPGKTPEKFNNIQDLERVKGSSSKGKTCSKADLEQAAFRQMTQSKSAKLSSSSSVDGTSATPASNKVVESSADIDDVSTSQKKVASKKTAGSTSKAKDVGPSDHIKIPEDKDGK